MTNSQEMAELKRAFLSCADKTYALMDSSKVGARSLMRFGAISEADCVIMDEDPQGVVTQDAEELGCQLILCGKPGSQN